MFSSTSSAPVATRSFSGERKPLSSVGRFDVSCLFGFKFRLGFKVQFSCRIHFVPTGSVSLAMSQDPFGPHDDVGGVLFSFLADLSNYFFLHRTVSDHFRIQAVEPSPTIPFFFFSAHPPSRMKILLHSAVVFSNWGRIILVLVLMVVVVVDR